MVQVASCVAYLPSDGAVAYELNGQQQTWDIDTSICADIANSLRWLVWAKTKDGEKGRNKPTMIEPMKKVKEKSYTADEIDEILSRKRI